MYVQVDLPKERFTVTLKQSLVGASDAAYLQSLFCDLEFAEQLRWVKTYAIYMGLWWVQYHHAESGCASFLARQC